MAIEIARLAQLGPLRILNVQRAELGGDREVEPRARPAVGSTR